MQRIRSPSQRFVSFLILYTTITILASTSFSLAFTLPNQHRVSARRLIGNGHIDVSSNYLGQQRESKTTFFANAKMSPHSRRRGITSKLLSHLKSHHGEINTNSIHSHSAASNNNNDNQKSSTSLHATTDGSSSETESEPESETEGETNLAEKFNAFTEMALPYYQESSAGRWLFAGMIAMTLLNSGVSVAFSYVGKDFWNALSSKDTEQFYTMLWRYGAALLVGSPVSVVYSYQKERLAVSWREWMTDRCLQLYSSNRVYYNLERGSEIDNPDQRITEDVRSFTAFSLTLFLTLLTSLIDLVSFSLILYSIQPQLFGAIIVYAVFGTVTTTALGKKLVGLNYSKLQKEADFRYSLVRIRDNAESIAFYAGEDIENKEVVNRLEKVIDNRKEINVAQRNVEFFTTSYNYFVQILPVWVVAPQYFSGAIQLGVVSQSAGAFNHVLRDLSVIVNQFEQLSSFSAAIDRLSSFMTAIRDVDESRSSEDGLLQLPPNATATRTMNNMTMTVDVDTVPSSTDHSPSTNGLMPISNVNLKPKIELNQMAPLGTDLFSTAPHAALSIHNLTLTTPDFKRTLIRNLEMSIPEGENLLIVGNSGAGKSSLLRAIAGLWTSGEGTINRPSDQDVYFLPQRPYCALGSLKDQLLYPSMDENDNGSSGDDYPEGHRLSRSHLLRQSLSDENLLKILEQVDLAELAHRSGDGDKVKGLYSVMDWSNTLSLGEQQRLAFARLLVNQPRFVILDEATSALDMVSEAKMYKLLQNMAQKTLVNGKGLSRAGMTFVSVGHRPSLVIYHDTRLRLLGEDGFSLESIEKSSSTGSADTNPLGVTDVNNI